ncbi:uncharacterized protein [Haliotis cracherodii]|uniref:uncharacterized protein n=1 Tax=Haliotis cracherodii TaxID=6455 RepID=UPI0039EC5D37
MEEKEQLERARRNRKGKLTLAMKELIDEVRQEQTDVTELRRLMLKVDQRMESVEEAHDRLSDVIESDEEYAKEQGWMERVTSDYRETVRRARMLLKETDDESSRKPKRNVQDQNVNAENDNVIVHSDDESGSNDNQSVSDIDEQNVKEKIGNVATDVCSNATNPMVGMMQAMALPRAQAKRFDGDPLHYHAFVASYENSVKYIYDDGVKLNLLRSLCVGRALDCTDHCLLKPSDEGLRSALLTLKERFGTNGVVVQAWVRKVTVRRARVEVGKLEEYADDLDNCHQALKALGYLNEMNNQATLKSIVEKLPRFLQQRWAREVYKLRMNGNMPALQDLTRFVRAAAIEVNDPVFGMVDRQQTLTQSRENPGNRSRVLMLRGTSRNKCWNCPDDHWPDECPVFQNLSPSERLKRATEKRVCFSCLKIAGKGHKATTCTRRRQCPNCDAVHHRLLHVESGPHTQQALVCSENENGMLPVISVEIGRRTCNAVFDSGASITLIREEVAKDCEFESHPVQVEIGTVGGEVHMHNTRAYKVKLKSANQQIFSVIAVGVPEITEVPEMSLSVKQKFEQYLGEPIHRRGGPIDLLIGVNNARMHVGEIREADGFVARKSPLGWVVFGSSEGGASNSQVLVAQLAKPVDLSQFWSTEEMGVRCMAKEESSQAHEMWDSCQRVDNHWEVTYPWIKSPDQLPDNRNQCFSQMKATESRLKKSADSAKVYNDAIQELVDRQFARRLNEEEIREYKGPVYYLPHHAVIRKESKSTPIRIVFNSSSKYQGGCINDYWDKGPDLLQSLVGVTLRFRQYQTAIAGDISKMYYQVRISERDQHVHRFLWRNFERRPPDTYVLQVVTPGDKPAPALAITALRKTAKEAESEHPKAAQTLLKDTYMDDICSSVPTDVNEKELSEDIDAVLASGGFKVKSWTSNGGKFKNSEYKENIMWTEEQKILGVVWDPKDDVLKYKVKQPDLKGSNLTKRIVLSELSKVYDPIGFAGAYLIKGKVMMQQLWSSGVSWDEELGERETVSWINFFSELKELQGVSFDRCLIPEPTAETRQLVTFCDASEKAFGAVCYTRWITVDGTVGVRFVAAKARVAPLKALTLPRLELQAAVLASRLATTVKQEMTVSFDQVFFLSDSVIVLSWIRGQSRQWKSFVANRVAEIQSQSDPTDWFHIPGEYNVADKVSRGVPIGDLTGDWRDGPIFLQMPKEQWPKSNPKADCDKVEKERKREKTVLIVSETERVIDARKFSRWRRLIRVTSYLQRFINNCRRKDQAITGPLTVEELSASEKYWILQAQTELKSLDAYKTLSPFVEDQIVYVGGRTNNQRLSYDTAYPALLPQSHHISYLIAKHVHETGHYGVASTAARVRRRYWIIGVTKLVKKIKHRCARCRAFEHKLEQQWMSDLPMERVKPFSPPFFYTAVDYFGPIDVKVGRNKTTKHYGVIFTCLNTRAVHLELAVDCSTQEFLQVLRRFFAVRGYPCQIQSDNGTQFVGTQRQLRQMIQGWGKDELKEYCAEKQVHWKFVTPLAPHQNGCAEALVKSCKQGLKKAVGSQLLTPFELYTCLQEVANLVNQRPIGRIPNDPDDGSYVCPNDLLLGRATSRVPQGPFQETRNPHHRFKFVQRIADVFWKRWIRDVFPTLVPRKKWNVHRRNVSVNDVIVMADPNAVRGQWKLGRIVEVYPGADGRVRNVKVRTVKGEFQRPVTKIAVLYPSEGFDEE